MNISPLVKKKSENYGLTFIKLLHNRRKTMNQLITL
jgi:hypothetical protein